MAQTSITKEFHRVSEQLLAIAYENECRTHIEISALYEKKYNVRLSRIAQLLGYLSDKRIFKAIPLLQPTVSFSKKMGKTKNDCNKITPNPGFLQYSAYGNRPSYETLLERLELTKQRIKELLMKSNNSWLDCHRLQTMYKKEYKDDLTYIHRQLGYYSIDSRYDMEYSSI